MSDDDENKVGGLLDRCRDRIERNMGALEDASERAIGLLRASLAPQKAARTPRGRVIKGAKVERAKEYDDKLVSHLAWLTIRITEVATSLRQLEKHDRAMSRTPEQRHRLVLAYIKQCDPVRRAEIGAEIGKLAEQRSVLQ